MPPEAEPGAPVDRGRIVVPVKPLREAKQRLAPALSSEGRAGLAAAMLRDVLDALGRSGLVASVVVVTNDAVAAGLAAIAGAEVRPDHERVYNPLLARIARELEREGAAWLAVVPADLPLLSTGDLAQLEELRMGPPAALLAGDRHGDGTNLLALSPPTLLAPSFGPRSLARHRAAAERASARVHIVATPGLGLDVDTPDDLAELVRRCEIGSADHAHATRAWLEEAGAARRFAGDRPAPRRSTA